MGPDKAQVRALAGHAWGMSGHPCPPLIEPLRVYLRHGNLRSGGAYREIFRLLCEAENHEERKALRQAGIRRGNSLPEGATIAIVTVIKLDFIRIIIITISTTRTITTTISTPSFCNIFGWILLVHRGNSPGINYYLF